MVPTNGTVDYERAFPRERKSYSSIAPALEVPNLIKVQIDSFRRFLREGLRELLNDISPIQDFTGNRLELRFLDYYLKDPKYPEQECRERDITYSAPLFVKVQLVVKETGEIKEQDLFMDDLPLITDNATFIINGAERVVVSQLIRSPGVYFTLQEDISSGRRLCFAKLIPDRGAWLEFETSNKDIISVKVDGKRKIPITTLLRAIGYGTDEILLELFKDVDVSSEQHYIQQTIERDPAASNQDEALLEFYRRLRPGDPPTVENATALITNLFFNRRRYDLGRVGRYKLNKRLGLYRSLVKPGLAEMATLELPGNLAELLAEAQVQAEDNSDKVVGLVEQLVTELAKPGNEAVLSSAVSALSNATARLRSRVLSKEDFLEISRRIIMVANGQDTSDDIDHLGNRRVRTVGELIQNQFRIGLLRLERVVKERMSIIDPEAATPSALVNIRPVVAAMREFFGGSQLSQFMDQTNPLAELTHKRRLSALGPGGLSRERAGFDVRDVHHSHYGRICPIETPEGPNIGLIGSLATYSLVNEYGFIETPYRYLVKELPTNSPQLSGRTLRQAVKNRSGQVVAEAGTVVDAQLADRLKRLSLQRVKVVPFVSDRIDYLSADKEENFTIAQANSRLNEKNEFSEEKVEVRRGGRFFFEKADKIDYMDVAPKQIVSVAASLIPFLEHDDANRALMGANMQRQAVPLLRPEAPLVATGMEWQVAHDSGHVVLSQTDGQVLSVTAREVVVRSDDGQLHRYPLMKFVRSNQGTCINQRPIVHKGDLVKKGHPLGDSSSTDHGELALGQNVLCAFMSWEGYNFEDAIIISDSLVREDKFTSIHIEKHEVEARSTKLGDEEITRDIPNVGEESLRNLDEKGIIRVGAEVTTGDILVGKITPKGETELTAEEKLLRAIFGEKAREVKDTSLRVPHGERGKVIDVKEFSRDNNSELSAGVNRLVRVWIAHKRKVAAGDKMAGRHGNKGVVSRIVPVEDMPYLPDGTPIQIILNPIGVPSRMNIGQVLETHLGLACHRLGIKALSPVFDGADDTAIEDALGRAWIAARSDAVDVVRSSDVEEPASLNLESAKAWLQARDFDSEQVFSDDYPGKASQVCLRLWLEDQGVDSKGLSDKEVSQAAKRAYEETGTPPPILGKTKLYDGRTGEPFDQPVTVGNIYMMKLIHLVEDKIHARSTGPYSLITQQPLGGKAQFGGQRFGEMEVWALEAYGAAHILQELLTVKSDDVVGRAKTYEAIVKGEDIQQLGVPESFKVLVKELQSLALSVEVLDEDEERVPFVEIETPEPPVLGINLEGWEKTEDA